MSRHGSIVRYSEPDKFYIVRATDAPVVLIHFAVRRKRRAAADRQARGDFGLLGADFQYHHVFPQIYLSNIFYAGAVNCM